VYWRRKTIVEFRKLWAVIRKDKYDRLVAELQDLLLQNWDQATRQAIADVIRALAGREKFSEAELNQMLQQLRMRLGIKFANDMAAPLFEIQLSAYGLGMKDIIRVKPSFQVIDQKALDALQRHNIFWIRNFWDEQLGQQVAELGRQVIEQGLSREKAGLLFEEAFSGRFENYSWRYWQGFSNHVVTRSRELGRVEGYVRGGIKYLEIRSVLDRRTTPLCREMHGRIIPVQDAVELRNAIINAKSPEEVKKIAPWRKLEEISGKPTSKLPKGMALPPYHFNCRTRTIMVKKAPSIKDIDFNKKGAGRELRESLRQIINNREQISGKELKKLIERAMGADWKDMKGHFYKHRNEKYTGWKSITEMNQMVSDLIRKGGRDIYLQIYEDKYPRIIFHGQNVMLAVDPIDKTILTMFSVKDITKQLQRRNSKFILQKKGKKINKWFMMAKNDKEVFELAYDAWVKHVQDLLDESDPYWQDRLLIARTEIEDYLEVHPEAVSEDQRKAIEKADRWLLDHADEKAIKKVIQGIPDKPSMKYWWEDIETLRKKREALQESVAKVL